MKIKKVIILTNSSNKPIKVLDIKDLEVEEYFKVKKQSEENLKADISKDESYRSSLEEKIKELEKHIAVIELELKYNRGDIDEETYRKEVKNYGLE